MRQKCAGVDVDYAVLFYWFRDYGVSAIDTADTRNGMVGGESRKVFLEKTSEITNFYLVFIFG
jgi:hypothetical protein